MKKKMKLETKKAKKKNITEFFGGFFESKIEKKAQKSKNKTSITKETIKKKTSVQSTLDFFGIKTPEANKAEMFRSIPKYSKLKIMSWNVNGIRSVINRGDFQNLILKEDPDILCLNETKIDQITLRKEKIEYLFNHKYLSYWNEAQNKKGYSGVAIFTKYKPISVTKGINISEHDQEGRVITIEFEELILISVYVPNSGENRLEYRTTKWDVSFRSFIRNLSKTKNKPIIIIGDMNVCYQPIDLYDADTHGGIPPFTKGERDNFGLLLQTGFVDSFRFLNKDKVEYSWFGSIKDKLLDKGYRLDYCLVDEKAKKNLEKSEIFKTYIGSDHVPIGIIYNY